MSNRFARFVARLEDARAPAALWAASFACVILIRALIELALEYPTATLLEIWIDGGATQAHPNLTAGSDDAAMLLLHWPGFYLTVFFGLTLALSLLAGERLGKTGKAVLLFFPIIWLPPCVDAIVTRGRGVMLEYNLTRSLPDLLVSFYHPGRAIAGVSPGIRVEIFLASVGAAIYVLAKGRGPLRAALAFVVTTLIPAAIGSWPHWIARSTLIPHDYPGSLHGRLGIAYLYILLPLGALWAWRADAARCRAAWSNLRWLRAFHYMAMAGVGFLIAQHELPGARPVIPEAVLPLAGVLAAVFFAFQFNVQLNDYVDRDIDAISNPERPLARRSLSERDVLWLAALYGVLCVGFAAAVGTPALLLILVYNALGLLYSVPPFRLRRFFLAANLVLAGCSIVAALAGFAVVAGANTLVYFPRRAVLLLLVTFVAAFNFKDLKDAEGDRAAGIRTLPVILGRARARWVVAGLMLAAYTSVPLLIGRGGLLWLAPLAGLATAALLLRGDKPYEPALFGIYFAYAALAAVVLVRAPHAPAFRAANLGYYHLLEGRTAEAQAALASDPGLSPFDRDVGAALIHTLDGDAPEAIERARSAAARAPGDTNAQLLYAYTLAAGGRADEAEAVYRAVAASDARAAGARFNLGDLAYARGDYEQAAGDFQAALAERPDWGEARFNLGNSLLKQGRAAEAEAEFRRALALLRGNANLHNNLGLALERQGKLGEARKEYIRALALDPGLSVARSNRDRVTGGH